MGTDIRNTHVSTMAYIVDRHLVTKIVFKYNLIQDFKLLLYIYIYIYKALAQDAACQSHTGRLTGLWFLLTPAQGLNTNE
jgi:hypothetical protein